jgi:hypothetical protein
MSKKYEFTGETRVCGGTVVSRIRSLIKFDHFEIGELGGWIESENNLSHTGNCWVGDEAVVMGRACVSESGLVTGNAEVSGEVVIANHAHIFGNAIVSGHVKLLNWERICGDALVVSDSGVFWAEDHLAFITGYRCRRGNAVVFVDYHDGFCGQVSIDEFLQNYSEESSDLFTSILLRIRDLK